MIAKIEKKALGKIKNAVNRIKVKNPKKKKGPKPIRRVLSKRVADVYNLGLSDSTLVSSIENLSQTIFNGSGGISRGIAYGDELTALTRAHNIFLFTVPANNVASFVWSPSQVGTGATNRPWIVFNTTNSYDPFAVGTLSYAGPFNTSGFPNVNPAKDTRVVHSRMRIVPTNAIVAQAGTVSAAYYSKLHVGSLVQANMLITSYTGNGISNQPYYRVFKGSSDVSLTYLPNRDSLYLNNGNDLSSTTRTFPGYYVVFNNPTSTALEYRVDIDVGIEYTPTDDYKALVQIEPPVNIDTSWHYINKIVRENWNKLVLNTESGYQDLIASMDAHQHQWTAKPHMDRRSMSDRGLMALEETKQDLDYCQIIEDKIGLDACGTASKLGRAAGRTATQLLEMALMGGPPQRGAVGF